MRDAGWSDVMGAYQVFGRDLGGLGPGLLSPERIVVSALDESFRKAIAAMSAFRAANAAAGLIAKAWTRCAGSGFWTIRMPPMAAHLSFLREVCGLELPGRRGWQCQVFEGVVKSAWAWYPHRDFVIACEWPSVVHRESVRGRGRTRRTAQRLHCDDGPALAWPDGWSVHAIHGIRIPFNKRYIVECPQDITIKAIHAETNAEIRRVMIERHGYARYLNKAGLRLVDSCPANHPLKGLRTARLFRDDSNDITLLDVRNSTPEPDGSFKRYVLSIDPDAYNGRAGKRCLAAMASTWRRSDYSLYFAQPEDYRPVAES